MEKTGSSPDLYSQAKDMAADLERENFSFQVLPHSMITLKLCCIICLMASGSLTDEQKEMSSAGYRRDFVFRRAVKESYSNRI